VQLPTSLRDPLVDELDGYLENFSSSPDGEAVANFLVEELEVWADDEGLDDIIHRLTEAGQLELDFVQAFENEMTSNDEFTYTGEEVVSLLEKLCGVEWVDDADFELDNVEDDETSEDDLSEEI